MAAINPSIKLAQTRSKIDAQQQIISLLEIELQHAILGGNDNTGNETAGDLVSVVNGIRDIYDGVTDGNALGATLEESINNEFSQQINAGGPADQSALRQLLYASRALLGELRIEEQQWLEEYNQEKAARKNLLEVAKA